MTGVKQAQSHQERLVVLVVPLKSDPSFSSAHSGSGDNCAVVLSADIQNLELKIRSNHISPFSPLSSRETAEVDA